VFIISDIISLKGEFHFKLIGFESDDIYSLCNSYFIRRLGGRNDEHFM
jgi:hypothetical protein